MTRARSAIRGLYAVTPDTQDLESLLSKVDAAIAGGAHVVQYRNKIAAHAVRLEQAQALEDLCTRRGVPLIINDHVDLALRVNASGVHIGGEDATLESARAALGMEKIIGVSCYNSLERAQSAALAGADYVAFGSFFPSTVKPEAVKAPIDLLSQGKRVAEVPIVAIGGITVDNAPWLIAAGADALAIISALFSAADVAAKARRFSALFTTTHDAQR